MGFRPMCRHLVLAGLLGGLSLGLVGCSDGLQVVPVSGTVTLDGQPLSGAHVSFQPRTDNQDRVGPGSYAVTDETGRYELRLATDDRRGAIVGDHRVRVLTNIEDDPDSDVSIVRPEIVPEDYREGRVTITVPAGGSESLDIAIPKR